MSVILETRALGKRFGDSQVLDDVSVRIRQGRVHAVVGENGAGKSTFLKILFGNHQPSAGEIRLDGEVRHWRSPLDAIRAGLGMVHQHFSLVENLSALENVILGDEPRDAWGQVDRERALRKIRASLPAASLDVPWAEPVGKLSVGYRQRIELMKALYRDARVLLLDEPTAVLTPQEVQDFFAALRALRDQGRTVVVITHKLREVEELADDVTVLRRGRHIWTRERSAVQREDIIEAMMGRERVPLRDERRPVVGDVVLRLEQVIEERGPGQSRRGACQGVDLEVRAGEIVGVAGVEGAGQRSLVECALGLKPYMGRVRVLGRDVDTATTAELRRDGVGLIPESRSREGLWGEQSCYGNLMLGFEERFARCGFLNWTALESTAGSWAREFDVRAADLNGEAQTLSGGNQQKLIFAREVNGRKPKLLICCQPTRGVDIGAIDLIHQKILALRNHGVGVLLISSELDELFALSDRVYCLFDGAVSAEFPRDQLDLQTVGRFMTSRAEAPA